MRTLVLIVGLALAAVGCGANTPEEDACLKLDHAYCQLLTTCPSFPQCPSGTEGVHCHDAKPAPIWCKGGVITDAIKANECADDLAKARCTDTDPQVEATCNAACAP